MGVRQSHPRDEPDPDTSSATTRDFARLGFTECDVSRLGASFRAMAGGSPVVSAEAFYRFTRIPRSRFAEKIFSALDARSVGALTFRDFATGLWTLCSLDERTALPRFAYYLLCPSGTDGVALEDLVDLLDVAYGALWPLQPHVAAIFVLARRNLMVRCGTDRARSGDSGGARLAEVMRRTDPAGAPAADDCGAAYGLIKPLLTAEEFYAIAADNASVLLPVFEIATTLRAVFAGAAIWSRLAAGRTRAGTMHRWSAADVLQALSAERESRAAATRAAPRTTMTRHADARVEGDPRSGILFLGPPALNSPAAPAHATLLAKLPRRTRTLIRHRGPSAGVCASADGDAWKAGENAVRRGQASALGAI
jgi:hypothetical protein